jgi:hypothetical protein
MEELLLREENIATRIYFVRGEKVMVDFDLAMLYGTETAQLKRAVRRNLERFPPDIMFELTREELDNLRCQIGISSWGGTRYLPFVFTEQGVAMLSSILNSDRAIKVNIAIMRTFVKIRQILQGSKELEVKLKELEAVTTQRLGEHEKQIKMIFDAIRQLMSPPVKGKKQIWFRVGKE